MEYFGSNDWRDYVNRRNELRHSWGIKPEQKAKEKEYNHEYYEKHKEMILAKRKSHGENSRSTDSSKITSSDEMTKFHEGDIAQLEDLLKINEDLGGYPPEVMANIRQHNQNIIDNLTALNKHAEEYLSKNGLSDKDRSDFLASYTKQVDEAMDLMLDLRKQSSRDYIEELGFKSSGNNSSTSPSKGSSGSAKSAGSGKTDSKIYTEGAKRRQSNQSSNKSSSSSNKDWWRRGDEIYEEATKKRNR